MEDACKAMDFVCAVEGSGTGFSESDSHNLQRLSQLKLELTSQRSYRNLLSEMLTYSILSCNTECISSLVGSLKDEITSTQSTIDGMVQLF